MTIPIPDHLLDQAERLAKPLKGGTPRQADLRRAVSAAYYGVFHHVMAALADEFVGTSFRTTARYALVYRSVNHGPLRTLCREAGQSVPSRAYAAFVPTGGFGIELQTFSRFVMELQDRRHAADYDPRPRFSAVETNVTIAAARRAVERFAGSGRDARKSFSTLLLCPPR